MWCVFPCAPFKNSVTGHPRSRISRAIECPAKTELGFDQAFLRLPEKYNQLLDEARTIRHVANDLAYVAHCRSAVIVRGRHHQVGSRKPVRRLDAVTNFPHHLGSNAERIELQESHRPARTTENGCSCVEAIIDTFADHGL